MVTLPLVVNPVTVMGSVADACSRRRAAVPTEKLKEEDGRLGSAAAAARLPSSAARKAAPVAAAGETPAKVRTMGTESEGRSAVTTAADAAAACARTREAVSA